MAELICMNSKVTLTFYRMRYKITEAKATGGEAMVKLYDKGVYLVNGTEIVEDVKEAERKAGRAFSRDEAAEQTMAYRILADHNTSGIWNACRLNLIN